jgi:hypothetical protein
LYPGGILHPKYATNKTNKKTGKFLFFNVSAVGMIGS